MKHQEREKNGVVDGLLFGSGDRELSKVIAEIDANYAKGPDENRRAHAYADLRQALAEEATPLLAYDRLEGTPFGDLLIAVSDRGVIALKFGGDEEKFSEMLEREHKAEVRRDARRVANVLHQLSEYFNGSRNKFEIAYDLGGLTPFQRRVLEAVQQIPMGSYVTYLELARRIGKPKAARAVGQALGHNPIPILIPCHRVIATDGSLGGYSGPGGVQMKSELLQLEGAVL
jgi:methylated-DNA-[protein]-cysteine S-methyltransferase